MVKAVKYMVLHFLILLLLGIWPQGLLASADSSGTPFLDVKGHWAVKEINYLAARGIVSGKEEGYFRPEEAATRGEFVKVLTGVLGLEPIIPEKATFKDVNPKKWYYPYVERVAREGLIQGYGGVFRPEGSISREEAAVILVRAMGLESKARELARGQIHVLLLNYEDREGVSPWADEYMALAIREHLFSGESGKALEPSRPVTRAEAAVLAVRLIVWLNML